MLQDIFSWRTPYDWQLDAAEALILGFDCVVVAGTGAGKTIPFTLPLFVRDSRTSWYCHFCVKCSGNRSGKFLLTILAFYNQPRIEVWTQHFRRSGSMLEAIFQITYFLNLRLRRNSRQWTSSRRNSQVGSCAKRYGEDVLKVLEPIDNGWAEAAEQSSTELRQ